VKKRVKEEYRFCIGELIKNEVNIIKWGVALLTIGITLNIVTNIIFNIRVGDDVSVSAVVEKGISLDGANINIEGCIIKINN